MCLHEILVWFPINGDVPCAPGMLLYVPKCVRQVYESARSTVRTRARDVSSVIQFIYYTPRGEEDREAVSECARERGMRRTILFNRDCRRSSSTPAVVAFFLCSPSCRRHGNETLCFLDKDWANCTIKKKEKQKKQREISIIAWMPCVVRWRWLGETKKKNATWKTRRRIMLGTIIV